MHKENIFDQLLHKVSPLCTDDALLHFLSQSAVAAAAGWMQFVCE